MAKIIHTGQHANTFIFSPRIEHPNNLTDVKKAYNHRTELVHKDRPGTSITQSFKLTPNIDIADAVSSGLRHAIIFQDFVNATKGPELVIEIKDNKLMLRQKYNVSKLHAEMQISNGTEYEITIETVYKDAPATGSTKVTINGIVFGGSKDTYTGRGLANQHSFTLGFYHNYSGFIGGGNNKISLTMADLSVVKK